jgi:hypothetical protein
MAVSVCPMGTASVPADRVWRVLTRLERYGDWLDGRVMGVAPPGPARAGQRVEMEAPAFGRHWPVHITVDELDPARRWLRLRVQLPFGVVNEERVALSEVGEGRTLVRFE